MSVRVVARVRPLLPRELDKDVIVRVDASEDGRPADVVKIPSPKNEAEEFSFRFNGVYDQATSQEALFNAEVAPHMKALFQGLDITLFAYGVTGTGKTHTMRGGTKLADRGVIPRLLSHVFRRAKKMMGRDADGRVDVDVALSYYEIYNDKVYDLLEPPEKRTPTGLPLREKDGKTHVVGLSEQRCVDLRDFEKLYIAANQNRVTAATKLNAHSSRSHAILRVKLTQTTRDADGAVAAVRESTASAIDLAGSEDNRRTDNGRERLVESAAINKSLFVLSQCVDAIARGEKRIPYRESKMTRILSLGQNNGITVMILNLAPVRSYHLDTLSSLTVSSRAKRIEVREIENEVVFKQLPRSLASSATSSASTSTTSLASTAASSVSSASSSGLPRQPLRALTSNTHNIQTGNAAAHAAAKAAADKPAKAFMVYTDRKPAAAAGAVPPPPTPAASGLSSSSTMPSISATASSRMGPLASLRTAAAKAGNSTSSNEPRSKLARPSIHAYSASSIARPPPPPAAPAPLFSAEQIEAIVERKVAEALAARTLEQEQQKQQQQQQHMLAQLATQQDDTVALATTLAAAGAPSELLSEAVQRRLDALERRLEDRTRAVAAAAGGDSGEDHDDPRAEGLRFLLLARQHKEVGDDAAALHYYEKARLFFPGQAKLLGKIAKLKARMARRRASSPRKALLLEPEHPRQKRKRALAGGVASLTTPTTPTFRRITKSETTPNVAAAVDLDLDLEHDQEADADGEEDAGDADRDEGEGLAAGTSASERSPRPRGKRSPGRKAAKTSFLRGPSGNGEDADDESHSLALVLTPRKKKLLDIVNSRDVARIRGLAGVSANTARDLVGYLERGGGVGGVDDAGPGGDDESWSPAATPIHRIESLAQLRNVPGMGRETVEQAYEGLVVAI